LEVFPSRYYRWKTRSPSERMVGDLAIKGKIQEIHQYARGRYGHRPIYHHLKDEKISCGRDRTLRLMNELGFKGGQAKRFKPLGTQSNHLFGYSPNLLKKSGTPTRLNQVWVADTTYLRID